MMYIYNYTIILLLRTVEFRFRELFILILISSQREMLGRDAILGDYVYN